MSDTDHENDKLTGQTMFTLVGDRKFPATRWTLVAAASDPARPESHAALAWLCENYWYPLYAYVRRRGYSAADAQDLTQQFILGLLEGRYLDRADPDKGRFRAFLLSSFKFFLFDEMDRTHAQKRGGGTTLLPFEISYAEELYIREPAHQETPERIFERRWARIVLDRVLERLREEFVQHGRLDYFNRLKAYLVGQAEVPYAELARQLGTSEGALKVGIHRLKKRYRELLRAEVAETVADPSQIDDELRYLAAALSNKS
jgi:RNA polymerase sigma-70 factor (ECF subfamily)